LNRIKVAAGIILKSAILKPVTSNKSSEQIQQILIAKRPNNKHQGGLWEFPGGKIETDESPQQALERELREEINISVLKSDFFEQIDFDYSDKKVSLLFFLVTEFSGEPKGNEGQEVRWADVSDLNQYEFPLANQEIVESLQAHI